MSSDEVVRIEGTAPSWEGSLEAWADYARKLKEVEEARRLPEAPPWDTLGRAICEAADAYRRAQALAAQAFAEAGAYATGAYLKQMADVKEQVEGWEDD